MEKLIFNLILKSLIWIFIFLGLAKWQKKFPKNQVANRTLVLIDEAKKQNIKIEVLVFQNQITKIFRAQKNAKKIIFEALPLGHSYNKVSQRIAENKWLAKKILLRQKIPVPIGRVFKNQKKAIIWAKNTGFPLVTKPLCGSQCDGVTININTFKKLVRGIKYAQKFATQFLIEKYIPGQNFRALIINQKLVAVSLRERPYVAGNGRDTIQTLINKKNSHPWRGGLNQKNFTLHKIIPDKKFLIEQGYQINNILPKRKKIYLSEKINLGSGADIYDVTNKIMSGNKKILEKTGRILDAQILGIDFIAQDLSKSWRQQNFAIIETNTLPYIDMHHYPLEGRPRFVAKQVWEMAFKKT